MAVLIQPSLRWCAAIALLTIAATAHAEPLQSLDGALANAFPGARIDKRTLALSAADMKAVSAAAHAKCDTRLVTASSGGEQTSPPASKQEPRRSCLPINSRKDRSSDGRRWPHPRIALRGSELFAE